MAESRKFNAIYNYSSLSNTLDSFSRQEYVCSSLRVFIKCIKEFCCSLDPLQQSTNYGVGSFPVGIYYSSCICSLSSKVGCHRRRGFITVLMNLREGLGD